MQTKSLKAKYGLRAIALGYLALLLILPVMLVFYQAFSGGLFAVWEAVTRPAALHALWLTLVIAVIVVPLNTVFGVLCALALVRSKARGRRLLNGLIDIPFTISPVIVGLALIIVYGKNGWLGGLLGAAGIQVIFALPGMVLATIFVSLPFVVREVVPVLREIGTDQEEAATILGATPFQTFWQVTLPAIRWGVAYGVILTTARSIGEYGAVSIVSGKIAGRTETLTTHVEERFQAFDLVGSYTASIVLAMLALATLLAMNLLNRSREEA